MKRTAGVDLHAARAAAAADPTDIAAALTVADLDVLGGHVEDASRACSISCGRPRGGP